MNQQQFHNRTNLLASHQIKGNNSPFAWNNGTSSGRVSHQGIPRNVNVGQKDPRRLAASDIKFKPKSCKMYVPNKKFPSSPKNSVTSLAKVNDLTLESCLHIIKKALTLCTSYLYMGEQFNFSLESAFLFADNILVITSHNPIEASKTLKEESVVVGEIIGEVRKICGDKKYEDFVAFYKRAQAKAICNYKYTSSLINSYCKCSKISISNTIQFISNQNILLNPENIIDRRGASLNHSRSNSRRKTLGDSDTASVPSFLKMKLSKSLQKKEEGKRLRKKSEQISVGKKLAPLIKLLAKSNNTPMVFTGQTVKNFNMFKPSKESQASTDFKTSTRNSSLRGDCAESFTFQNKMASPFSSNTQGSYKSIPISQEPELSEVQSQCESSSDNEKERKLSCNKISQSRIYEQAYEGNQWTKKYDNLFAQDTGVIQSFVDGKDQYSQNLNNEQVHLGRLARAVVESYLPQFSSRKHTKLYQ